MTSKQPNSDERYDTWERVSGPKDAQYLGVTMRGPIFYDRSEGTFYDGHIDEAKECIRLEENETYHVDGDELLSGVLQRIGDDVGWDSLSDWAETHLEDDETSSNSE